VLELPGRQPWRRSPVRVRHGCPPTRFRRPGPGCPARPVSSHTGSSSAIRRPAVWCPPVQCPALWCPPRPSGRVRLSPLGGGGWGPGRCGAAPAPRQRAQVPVGWRVERLGSTTEPARTPATPPRSPRVGRAVDGGPGPGRVRATAGLDAGLPHRPGRGAERPWPAAARGHGRRPPPGCRTGRVAAVLGLGARPRCVVVAEPDARAGGPGGATGHVGGGRRTAPARPKPAASAPGSVPAAL
jgi:hypothetical protein